MSQRAHFEAEVSDYGVVSLMDNVCASNKGYAFLCFQLNLRNTSADTFAKLFAELAISMPNVVSSQFTEVHIGGERRYYVHLGWYEDRPIRNPDGFLKRAVLPQIERLIPDVLMEGLKRGILD